MKPKHSFHGYSLTSVAKLANVQYSTAWRHFSGHREISAEYAMRYHKTLGIPLSDLRPDLWPPEQEEKTPTQLSAESASQDDVNGS